MTKFFEDFFSPLGGSILATIIITLALCIILPIVGKCFEKSDPKSKTKLWMVPFIWIVDLLNGFIKNNIGKLSAFCGVVIAGTGCGCGVAYLEGGKEKEIAHTIVNSLAIISGVLCDGAKSSCAAKIASSVEAGIFGYYMYKEGNQFLSGEGIIKKGVENTIKTIGDIARVGMCETDKEIISIMTK